MAVNKYKVGKSQWKKWDNSEKTLFNLLYEVSLKNQWMFKHPLQEEMQKSLWQTIAWNHAWMAADFMRELRLGGE